MNREIKFRAWNTKEKKMIHTPIGFSGMAKNDWIVLFEKIPEGTFNCQNALFSVQDFEVMQFTGLKDKNGREIYEGDIVKVNHPEDMSGDFTNTLGKVIFDEGCFVHVGHRGRPPKTMWEYCEVVGNIYENPELLTEVKK